MARLAAILAALVNVAPLAPAGEEVTVDGVLHVRNGATPPDGVQRLELEEIWRIDDESDLLLGLPTRVAVDGQRRVFILDAQLNCVHVFSLEGEFLATLSREGDGPGEMRNPSDMIVEDAGDVGIVQEFPGKVVRFDFRGDPLPTLYPGGPPEEGGWGVLVTGRARGDQYVVGGQMTRRDEAGKRVERQFLSSFHPDGMVRATYVERSQEDRPPGDAMVERELLQPFLLGWDVAPDGRVYVADDWVRYAIRVFTPTGKVDRIIEREYEPWRRTPEEKARLQRLLASGGESPPFAWDDFAPTVSLFQAGLQISDRGELWVHSSRGNRDLPPGVLAAYDVFDPAGHYRRRVEVACPGDPWNDRLLFVDDSHVIRVRRFVDCFLTSLGPGGLPQDEGKGDGATPAVIAYRLKK